MTTPGLSSRMAALMDIEDDGEVVEEVLRDRWKFAQKFHLFQHLCEIQLILFGNARAYWIYGDEDFQGIVKLIALSLQPSTVALNVLSKWACDVFP